MFLSLILACTMSQMGLSGCSMEDEVKCTEVYATEQEARAAVSAFFNSGSTAAETLISRLRAEGASDATLKLLTYTPRCACPARESIDQRGRRMWRIGVDFNEMAPKTSLVLQLRCDGRVYFEDIYRGV